MRILILSQYYAPEPIPKPVDLAHALRNAGDEVTVITGFPNYPSGILYPGYRLRPVWRETVRGIRVVRTFEYPYHGTRALGRFANYLSFMLSAPIGSFFAPEADVIYVWHPPLTVGVAAWVIARFRGIPFVYDVQDIWPEAAVLAGVLRPGRLVRWLSALERFVYRRADHILVVTEGARANLVSKGVPSEKVSAMPHWFDESLFPPESRQARKMVRQRMDWEGKCVLLFAGNLGLVQGLETILQAAQLLRTESSVRFVFVGDGADKARLQEVAAKLKLDDRVQFIDRQPLEKMPEFMAAADALLVHLKDSELSNYVIPTKTLAYLASGTPIIMAMHGAAAELVQTAGAGIMSPPDNPAALADAVRRFLALPIGEREAMGRRGREYLHTHMTRDITVPRYRAILECLVRQPS